MNQTFGRILMALFLSGSCFLGTQYWYKKTALKAEAERSDAPVGTMLLSKNDVQKKTAERLIWNPVLVDETLFNGDAIRTGADSSARIELQNGQTIIDLEPDSAIIISDQSGKFTMEFIKGQLFVKTTAPPEQAIALKSGEKTVELKNIEATLEKDKKGEVNVQITKGKDENLAAALGKRAPPIEILSPLWGEIKLTSAAEINFSSVKWKKLDPDYQVKFERGDKRNKLELINELAADEPNAELKAPMKSGTNFWRLRAISRSGKLPELSSSSMKVTYVIRQAPIPKEPIAAAKINLNDQGGLVNFRWENPGKLSGLSLEVSENETFQEILLTKQVGSGLEAVLEVKKTGRFFWRISGLSGLTGERLASSIIPFEVFGERKLQPSILIKPDQKQTLSYLDTQSQGTRFNWTPVASAQSYQIVVEKFDGVRNRKEDWKNVLNAKIVEQTYLLKSLLPGRYRWNVTPMAEGYKDALSETREFTIKSDQMSLSWTDGKTLADHLYISEKPNFEVQFNPGPKNITTYRYRLAPKEQGLEEKQWKPMTGFKIKNDVAFDGNYLIVVEGRDVAGQVIAKTPVREMKIQLLPLLPPPEFAFDGQELTALPNGSAQVLWRSVSGAKNYRLVIKREPAGVIHDQTYDLQESTLQKLMPGEYIMQLSSQDQFGRQGPLGEEKKLIVPDKSDVKAPKLKNINVE